jgi:protein farnesyltransferase subunit beta
MAGYQWTPTPIVEEGQVFDEVDRVEALDPVFVVPVGVADRTRSWFEGKGF